MQTTKNHPAVETVIDRIRRDAIGGAADVAKEVVAALAKMVEESQTTDDAALAAEVEQAARDIMRVTPSFAPPINALHRVLGRMEAAQAGGASAAALKQEIQRASADFLSFAETALEKVAQYGAEKVSDGDTVFMYSMSSTVWRILRRARAQGKAFHVIVTESRPGNEGLWTVREMEKSGIPVSVSIDACIGELVPESDVVFVGADAISSTGAAFVKVGTYPTALIARAHGVPFYVAADTLKFDPGTLLGLRFRGEALPRNQVVGDDFPASVKVVGDLFEEVPPELITGVVTEMGLLAPTSGLAVMWQMKLSDKVNAMIPAWARGEL